MKCHQPVAVHPRDAITSTYTYQNPDGTRFHVAEPNEWHVNDAPLVKLTLIDGGKSNVSIIVSSTPEMGKQA